MKIGIFALVAIFAATGPAVADEKVDVMVPVRQFVDSYSRDDLQAIASACTDQTSIVFDVPPYEWHGPGACARWLEDARAESIKLAITDAVAVLHKPRHIIIRDGHAYVVATVDFSYKIQGKRGKELGGTMVFVLQKSEGIWRIIGLTLALL
jgi:ketosteroid isomerase-like protein